MSLARVLRWSPAARFPTLICYTPLACSTNRQQWKIQSGTMGRQILVPSRVCGTNMALDDVKHLAHIASIVDEHLLALLYAPPAQRFVFDAQTVAIPRVAQDLHHPLQIDVALSK